MCRALVIMPGLICWGKTQVSVSLVKEKQLMTYQTMGLIDFAQLVAVKSLNISVTSYVSVSMERMLDN